MKLIALLTIILTTIQLNAEEGIGTYYTVKSNRGTQTASGIPFDETKLTAAHKTLPFGTKVKVTNKNTKQSVVVTITDRGPFTKGRVIDLSPSAAKLIGITSANGIAPVKLEKVH